MTDDGLDPEIRGFRDLLNADYAHHGTPRDRTHRRAIAEAVRTRWTAGGPAMAETYEPVLGGVRCRLHRPVAGKRLPLLVYVHGGGWTIFSLDTHDRLMRELAAASGCAVLGVDYSLSPEVRFPHALDEIADVLSALPAAADDLGIDPARIAAGGDSAGANLALASAIRGRDAGRPLAALFLAYGAFDTARRASHDRYGGDAYILTPDEMDTFWADYLDEANRDDVLARPLHADLAGLPPTFLCIPECDVLADENLAMRDALAAAGVAVTATVYPGATHSFLEATGAAAVARRAVAEAGAWLAVSLLA